MVACVADRNVSGIMVGHDKETDDYEKVNKILIN